MSDSTPTLHITNKSPDSSRFHACLSAFSDSDTVLLTESAVLAVTLEPEQLPGRWLALEADLAARGLRETCPPERIVTYAGWVTLTEEHTRIISW